jgi:hypothetical protein
MRFQTTRSINGLFFFFYGIYFKQTRVCEILNVTLEEEPLLLNYMVFG